MTSLEKALFVCKVNSTAPLPHKKILKNYNIIRDAIARTQHIESHDSISLVCNASFIYSFNAYKSIGLLLPGLYHESASAILRQIWEVSLNLHWIGMDPESRSQDFMNYTTVEARKTFKLRKEDELLASFDKATEYFQHNFLFEKNNGKPGIYSNFAAKNIHDRAIEVGEPWSRDYDLVYMATSMHAHGAPGAILHGVHLTFYPDPKVREQNSTALIAVIAIKLMKRNIELLERLKIIPEKPDVFNIIKVFEKSVFES